MNFLLLPALSTCVALGPLGDPSHPASSAFPITPAETSEQSDAQAPRPVVDLAICLDTSGSMDGLIDAARRNIWAVVNDLALADPAPEIRISFLTFGNDGHDAASGWVKIHAPLTGDLDLISQELFAQETNGGTELVARVVDRATNALDWHTDPNSLKIIIVAGNEGADQDTTIHYQDACRRAIAKGIMVNSIYCGAESDAEASAWREVSMLADGSFATIDQNETVVEIPTPFDTELMTLNESFNGTYLAYGADGSVYFARQTAEDINVTNLGTTASVTRTASKASPAYGNAGWDLCDAVKERAVVLEELEEDELPEEMKNMTPEERTAHVAAKQAERDELAKQVQELTQKRNAFLAKEKARMALDESRSLGTVLRAAIRKQAEAKGVHIPPPPAVEKPAEETADSGA